MTVPEKSPSHRGRFRSLVLALAFAALVAAHLLLFHRLFRSHLSRAAIPGVILLGMFLLVVAKHLGLLAALSRKRLGSVAQSSEIHEVQSSRR